MNRSTASREPAGRVWTASRAIGKMQLDGPTQAMQLSGSPRRRALIPSRAVMWAGTSAGTPGVRDSASAFFEPRRPPRRGPPRTGRRTRAGGRARGPATPARASASGRDGAGRGLLPSRALARSPRRAIASRYSRSEPSSRTLSVNCAVAARMSASNATGSRNTRADDPGGAFGSGNVVSPGRG